MRRFASLLLVAAGLFSAAAPAGAEGPWYGAASAGAMARLDASRSTTFFNGLGTSGPGTNRVTFDPGPVIDFAVGYRLGDGVRMEGELGYAHDAVTSARPLSLNGAFPEYAGARLGLRSGGGRDGYSATINGYYDFPLAGPLVPYVGAGVGVEDYNAATARFSGDGGAPKFTEHGAHAAYAAALGEIGVALKLSPRWSIVPAYRYEHLFVTGSAFHNDANIYRLGVRYGF